MLITSASGSLFKEDLIGGGPWLVKYTAGTPILWATSWGAGKVLNSKNQASQAFVPGPRTAVNKVCGCLIGGFLVSPRNARASPVTQGDLTFAQFALSGGSHASLTRHRHCLY
jgi:hypothetical protein